MQIKVLIILSLSLVTSCNFFKDNGIDVEITNNSDFAIENIKFYTSEKVEFLEFDHLKPSHSAKRFLSMTKNQRDGSYVLEYNRVGKQTKFYNRGYYTNGTALDNLVQFDIKNDTTHVKFIANSY
ncbi:MAG: hypothetical protein ACPGU9_01745 [Flavobacteriaceae bacterium]